MKQLTNTDPESYQNIVSKRKYSGQITFINMNIYEKKIKDKEI